MFSKYKIRKFINIETGDESWFISAKKVMYTIFFGNHRVVAQFPVPKKRPVNAKGLQDQRVHKR